MPAEDWLRTSRNRRCPICGKPDWCLLYRDGSAAICARMPEGSERYLGEAGWLHKLDGHQMAAMPAKLPPRPRLKPTIDAPALALEYQAALSVDVLEVLAADLGIRSEALLALAVGWSQRHRAFSFPMWDEHEKIVGIRLRSDGGRKWAVRGSRQGLFLPPVYLCEGPLCICEGPTDAAALVQRCYDVIGRPSNRGGVEMIVRLLRSRRRRDVVIFHDRDPRGTAADRQTRAGAEDLAGELVKLGWPVKLIRPPGSKDLREWVAMGATRAGIDDVIGCARYWVPKTKTEAVRA